MWLTRDTASLVIWNTKPYFDDEYQEWFSENPDEIDYIELDYAMFPEVTNDNSPVKVKLIIEK